MLNNINSPPSANEEFGKCDLSHSPLVAFYEVTQACDLACQHCRASALTKPHRGELDTAESLRLLDQLREFPKPPLVVLTGGDPLKRSDIYNLIRYATDRGLRVSITPSATPLVTRQALRRLRDSGISRLAISLDGATAATHDAFRGVQGSFERTLEIASTAGSLGMQVQVNTTITPMNLMQVDAIADLLADLDVVMWSVFFLVPVGRADTMQRLTPEQYEWTFERLWLNAQIQPYPIKTTEAPQYRRYAIQHQQPEGRARLRAKQRPQGFSTLGINDGKGVMFIGHTGIVYPSGFMPILCGVFPQQHVVDIYQRSPIMEALRDASRLQGKCHVCEFRHLCGGSRARAYAVTGNPFAQEPDCDYQPVALSGGS